MAYDCIAGPANITGVPACHSSNVSDTHTYNESLDYVNANGMLLYGSCMSYTSSFSLDVEATSYDDYPDYPDVPDDETLILAAITGGGSDAGYISASKVYTRGESIVHHGSLISNGCGSTIVGFDVSYSRFMGVGELYVSMTTIVYSTVAKFSQYNNNTISYECPPCYSLINGQCVYNETIPGCGIPCYECTGVGTTEPVICGERNKFYVYREQINDKCSLSDPLTTYLSYTGSTVEIINPVRQVTINAGQNYAYFYVELGTVDGRLKISTSG